MDTWSAKDVAALEAGGNIKWITVAMAANIYHLPVTDKYNSPVADAYRKRYMIPPFLHVLISIL